jgi:arylsulfatase A-like enzyme
VNPVNASAVKLKGLLLISMAAIAGFDSSAAIPSRAAKPNIVFILADDLGYGDVKCFNPEGKIPTPNMDRLASEGMKFTDAHSSSAVCTPTRYSILTGRYNWRSRLKSGVLQGFSPRLIEPERLTVPAFLRQQGYVTACIGKWHLGMDWPLKNGGVAKGYNDATNADYSRLIQNGPNAVGFDYYFGISASLDMPPFVFIENDHVTEAPTVEKKWVRTGPAAESFDADNVLPTLTSKAVEYLAQHAAAAKQGKPFFLYLPLSSPHAPIVPTKDWRGKSGLNAYADFVMQTDASVGRVLAELDKQAIADSTLVIMTSDNGCSPVAKIPELLAKGHNPSYHFRGYKADIFDGGHRIPLIVRWPGRIKAGTSSDQTVCLVDFFRTCADVLAIQLPDTAAEDSVSLLPALEGRSKKPLHEAIVHHSINGSFSIREGKWKLELCSDSGGWSDPRPGTPAAKPLPAVQLYDLSRDIGEEENVQARHPEVVRRLTALLEKYVAEGRSTPGTPQPNAGKVEIRGRGNQSAGD